VRRLSKIPLVAALGVGLAVAGCGDDNKEKSSATPSGPTQTLQLSADPGGALKFDKTKLTAKAGTVKIVMDNPQSTGLPHGVGVDGNGVDEDGPTVQPGETSTVTATLKAGTYEFYCTVNSHQQAGMKGTLTVG
jgi:plastocyanin